MGAAIDLHLPEKAVPASALALKAQGGVPPFTWIVNGAPIGQPDLRRQSTWAPDGAGFARMSVIDAKGASESVVVRMEGRSFRLALKPNSVRVSKPLYDH